MTQFKTIREKIGFLGFISNHHDYSYYPFTEQHLRTHLKFCLTILSLCIFAIRVANTSKEYMDSAYIVTATSALFISYVTLTFKTIKLFKFFDSIENFTNERKLKPSCHNIWIQEFTLKKQLQDQNIRHKRKSFIQLINW